MSKQGFVEVDGALVDPARDDVCPLRPDCVGKFPEEVEELEREALATDVRRRLPEIMTAVRGGSASNALALIGAAGESDEVRAAVLEGFSVAGEADLVNFAQAVGRIGGRDALKLLRQQSLVAQASPASSSKSFRISTIAASILTLDPDDDNASASLAAELTRDVEGARAYAAARANDVIQDRTMTRPMINLRNAVGDRITDTTMVFLAACRVLVQTKRVEARERVHEMLRAKIETEHLVWTLLTLQGGDALWAAGVLRAHLFSFPLELSLPVAARFPALFDEGSLVELARRALASISPTNRLAGLTLLANVQQSELRRSLLGIGRRDEPDVRLIQIMDQLAL